MLHWNIPPNKNNGSDLVGPVGSILEFKSKYSICSLKSELSGIFMTVSFN